MHGFRVPLISLAAVLTVAACDKRDPVAREANDTASLPAIEERAPSASGEPHGNATVPAAEQPAAAAGRIPAALHGRWGLTPADCTPGPSHGNQGLLVVTADEMRFYESVAVPARDLSSSPTSISGQFSFTGEGQSWTKFQALKAIRGQLVRTQTNPAASFTYAKCE